ncbi:hypothetical protein IFM46972_09792 [Aspergillus udagawae]|uniref:F-box domain-containing protein n=1 Tax=Aspergillus udagawae TaxID=91492 RepID=A0A8H3S8I4_9EURO|nr:hypothetical protein IFM46972_09792 [Aspergillus udagawae]
MAARLPFELLCEIAVNLQDAGASLVACTTVCRRWQAVFESFIYSELKVYSEDGYNGRSLCLNQFREFTSGPRITRRVWVRQLRYYIVLPFELPDWTTHQEEGYTTNNPVRQANDTAFQSAVINLFNTLESWDKIHRLSVVLVLRGRELGEEPYTTESEEVISHRDGLTQSVPVHRARFNSNGTSMLRDVLCIDKISLPKGIWAGAMMQIVRHCPELTELYMDLDRWITPGHLEYMKQRRQAVAEGLKDISLSLRVFHFAYEYEWDWQDVVPALNVLSSSVDVLSIRIRELSLSLRELQLGEVPVSLDFLWPLDEEDHSLPANKSLHWPNLEILSLSFQPFLPSGERIVHLTAEGRDMSSYETDELGRPLEGPIFKQEQFHRLFISLGYAARRMPRVRAITLALNHPEHFWFRFITTDGSISVQWEIGSCGLYMPDDQVAAAWGFQLDHLQLTGLYYEAILSDWPPIERKSM